MQREEAPTDWIAQEHFDVAGGVGLLTGLEDGVELLTAGFSLAVVQADSDLAEAPLDADLRRRGLVLNKSVNGGDDE